VTFSPSQAAYIAIITKRFGLAELQKTPMLPSGAVYSKDDIPSDPSYVTRKKDSRHREAAKAIGSLMHAAVATRPYIDSPYLSSSRIRGSTIGNQADLLLHFWHQRLRTHLLCNRTKRGVSADANGATSMQPH
jgi:hypothetical protein